MKYLPDVLTLLGACAFLYGVQGIYRPAAWVIGGAAVLAIGLQFARVEAQRTRRGRRQ